MAHADNVAEFDLRTIRPKGGIFDINLAGDKVLIPDLSNEKVVILDSNLKQVEIKDVPSPHGVAAAPDGSWYVTTFRKGQGVKKFSSDGKEIEGWDKDLREHFKAPVAIEPGLNRNLYIADWITQKVMEVTDDGKLIRVFEDGPITQKAQFQAHGIAVDGKNKRIYVADRGNEGGSGTIHAFSLEGKYLSSWARPSGDFDPFTVRRIAEDLYLVPTYTNPAIYIFNADGKLLEKMDIYGDKPGQFLKASSVIVDKDGFMYAPELDGNRIQKVDFRAEIERLKRKNASTD